MHAFGDLVIDPEAREVTLAGVPVRGEAWVGDEHIVDIHLGHVRRKLDDDSSALRYILPVRGVGYRMGTG